MLSEKLLSRIHCINCSGELIVKNESELICESCNATYSTKYDVPQLIKGTPIEEQDWNEWNTEEIIKTGDSYRKRATGELPEKESSKSYSNLMLDKGVIVKSGVWHDKSSGGLIV